MNKRYSFSKTIILLCMLLSVNTIIAQKTSLSRVHENVRETPYPQRIHSIYINPAPLIIPEKMKTDDFVQFELSMDSTFLQNKTITAEPKPWLIFNPHQILKN